MHNLEVPARSPEDHLYSKLQLISRNFFQYNICLGIWISLIFTYLLHIIHTLHLKAIDFTQNIYFFIKSANLYINAGYMSYIQLVHDINYSFQVKTSNNRQCISFENQSFLTVIPIPNEQKSFFSVDTRFYQMYIYF